MSQHQHFYFFVAKAMLNVNLSLKTLVRRLLFALACRLVRMNH